MLLVFALITVCLGALYIKIGLEDSDKVASIVGSLWAIIIVAAAPFVGKWLEKRPTDGTSSNLLEVIGALADRVEKQWVQDWRLRRLESSKLLPVAWETIRSDLFENWGAITRAAQDSPGGPLTEPADWPTSLVQLNGCGGEVEEILVRRLPLRRLVVLGEPGSGKTVLLTRILFGILRQRTPETAVPVVFSLASWDCERQNLDEWMARQLVQDHTPALLYDAPAESRRFLASYALEQARKLIAKRKILPLLDGFDELPEALHPQALGAINEALSWLDGLVLASRTAEYERALSPGERVVTRISGAVGIRLLPLSLADAKAYLHREAGGEHTVAALRWNSLFHQAGATHAGSALRNPLQLFLASCIYNARAGERLANIPHPQNMLSYATEEALKAHLYQAYLPAVYRVNPEQPCRWSTQKAERTLCFLARHLEVSNHGVTDIRWWDLSASLPNGTARAAVSALSGIAAWLGLIMSILLSTFVAATVTALRISEFDAWSAVRRGAATAMEDLSTPTIVGMLPAMVAAVASWFAARSREGAYPALGIRWSWRRFLSSPWRNDVMKYSLALALGGGVTIGVSDGLLPGLEIFVLIVAMVGGGASIASGLAQPPPDQLDDVVGPPTLAAQDRRSFQKAAWLSGLAAAGLAACILTLLALKIGAHFPQWLIGTAGLATGIGIAIGLSAGLAAASWGAILATSLLLSARKGTPFRMMEFMADAHQVRGVLRQAGAVYQFRHRELQQYLARTSPD